MFKIKCELPREEDPPQVFYFRISIFCFDILFSILDFRFWILILDFDFRSWICFQIIIFPADYHISKLVLLIAIWVFNIFFTRFGANYQALPSANFYFLKKRIVFFFLLIYSTLIVQDRRKIVYRQTHNNDNIHFNVNFRHYERMCLTKCKK